MRLVTPRLDDAAFDALRKAMAVMESASQETDVVTMTEANRRYHFVIVDAAGMPRMTGFIRQLWQSTDAYRARYYGGAVHRARVNEEHRLVKEALRAGMPTVPWSCCERTEVPPSIASVPC